MTTPNVPIVAPVIRFINDFQVSWLTTTTLSISAGAASDSTDVNYITLNAPVTINAALSGVINGLDQGALVATTFYYVFVVGDSTGYQPAGGLLSLSATNPVIPRGYDMFQLVASGILTDGGALILEFSRTGNGNIRRHTYALPISVLSGGAATSYAAVDLTAAIPVVSTQVFLVASITPQAAGHAVHVGQNGLTLVNGQDWRSGSVATVASVGGLSCPCDATGNIQYKVDNSGDATTLYVAGYNDVLY